MLGVHGERANMARTLNYGALAREQMTEIETMQDKIKNNLKQLQNQTKNGTDMAGDFQGLS